MMINMDEEAYRNTTKSSNLGVAVKVSCVKMRMVYKNFNH